MRMNLLTILGGVVLLTSCADMPMNNDEEIVTKRERKYHGYGKFFGEDTLLFGGESSSSKKPEVGIGVNAYLWRASLDTLSFMPLKSVDPFGGVILTEWYTPKSSPNERMKVDVRILDRVLRADGLSISVFRQEYKKGRWVNAGVTPATKRDIEDAILIRARQLKSNSKK